MSESADILVVEDDPALRTMLRALLELNDYKVSVAEHRAGAMALLHADPGLRIGERVTAGFFVHEGRTLVRFARADPAAG